MRPTAKPRSRRDEPISPEAPDHDAAPGARAEEQAAPRGNLLLSLSLPNQLTLSRLLLSPLFAWLLLLESRAAHLAALVLYFLLALTDLYDGWLARRTGIVTSFGKFMDPLADKVLFTLALIVFLAMDLPFVPAPLVLVIVAREFLVTGLRSLTGYRGVILVPSLLAKVKTTLGSAFVLLALGTIVLRESRGAPIDEGAANGPLLILLASVTALTVISGLLYLVGYREMIRRIFR